MKAEKIYIIEQSYDGVSKSSYNRENFFKVLDIIDEDSLDEYGDFSTGFQDYTEKLFGEDYIKVEQLVYELLFGCEEYCNTNTTLQQRIDAIKSGNYCAENEEVTTAIGFNAKDAKANLIQDEDDLDW